jgi:hypothetical protein
VTAVTPGTRLTDSGDEDARHIAPHRAIFWHRSGATGTAGDPHRAGCGAASGACPSAANRFAVERGRVSRQTAAEPLSSCSANPGNRLR